MSTKDWLEKDYYKILGVSKDAKADEIKKAFRKIARENHPDQHPGDKAREQKFKEASEANSVLSDPSKRQEYDQQRSLFGAGGFGPGGFGRPGQPGFPGGMSVDDILRNASGGSSDFGDLFGGLFGGGGGRRGPSRGSDVEGSVTIDFADSATGTTVSLPLSSDSACGQCRGTGARAGTSPKACPTCQGSGTTTGMAGGMFATSEPCRTCHGRGVIVDDPCPNCAGSGRERTTRTIQIRIPAGVTDGQKIRIKGRGGAGRNGGASGDLYVLVNVRPHKLFGRSGDHLTITIPVLFTEAALGAEVDVPTLDGDAVRLRIPAGTPNGRTFRVRNRGVTGKGDLLVSVEVQVPATMNDQAAELLSQFRTALAAPDPRAGLFE